MSTNKQQQQKVVIHLLLGGMGFGKTTVTRFIRDCGYRAVFDTDEAKSSATEGYLRDMRRRIITQKGGDRKDTAVTFNPWTEHNVLWFAQIWAGIAVTLRFAGTKQLLVADHGGHFIMHKTGSDDKERGVSIFGAPRVKNHNPDFELGFVFGLTLPLEVALARVEKRAGAEWNSEMATMTASSHRSCLKAEKFFYETWGKKYVPLRADQSLEFIASEIGRRLFNA